MSDITYCPCCNGVVTKDGSMHDMSCPLGKITTTATPGILYYITPDKCKWAEVIDFGITSWDWKTSCGQTVDHNHSYPQNESGWNYCPYCGKPIEFVEPKESEEE